MIIEFYSNYSTNYSKMLVKNAQGKIAACLYINKANGAIECDSWFKKD